MLASGSLASREHSGTTGIEAVTRMAGLAFPFVLLEEETGRVEILCFRERVWLVVMLAHLDGLVWTSRLITFGNCGPFQPWNSVMLWVPRPHETLLKTDHTAFPPTPLFFNLFVYLKDCRWPRPWHWCSVTCKVLWKSRVLGGAATRFMLSVQGRKASFLGIAVPTSSRIPVDKLLQ